MIRLPVSLSLLLCACLLQGRQAPQAACSTHYDKWREEVQLHREAEKNGRAKARKLGAASLRPDKGNIAVLDDGDGVVARRNPFNLNRRTLKFRSRDTAASRYRFELAADQFDEGAAVEGTLLRDLGDDDSRPVAIPFAFPFFGKTYREMYVNSDGNITFEEGDAAITDRSLGRFTAGAPRIAALFLDLDPTQARNGGGVKTAMQADRFTITWDNVPEYRETGTGPLQTAQLRLYRDGSIEMVYLDGRPEEGVVGITPGRLLGATAVVSFADGVSSEYTAAVVERFTTREAIDIFAAAQKFYLNHDDAYDYLVIYNTLGISADTGAVAYEVTVRNDREGYGDEKVDAGFESGSKRRLQAILNMGQLTQYPLDPNGKVPARASAGDTPLTAIGHEAGHLFLAFASVRDGNDPDARPMLGYQSAHWNFRFNSEASLLEGNRIQDNGEGVSPRFLTTGMVEGYSALDQYLMGLRAPTDVPDMFLVTNARGANTTGQPRLGVAFDGDRRNIRIEEIIQAEGRRTPDSTVAQRKFRFAFIAVTPTGTDPTEQDLQQIEVYRRNFEDFFSRATGGRAVAETSIVRSLRLSTWPAAGVREGEVANGTVSIERPQVTTLTIALRTTSNALQAPAFVTIPGGATQASFSLRGLRAGVEDLVAEATVGVFESVQSRVAVTPAANLRLAILAGDLQTARAGTPLPNPIQVKVTDSNNLPYAGVSLQVAITGGGIVDRGQLVTDENGVVSLTWIPGSGAVNELRFSLASGAAIVATALGRPVFTAASVVNAASFAAGIVPGSIATIFGSNLGDQVSINGVGTRVFYSSPRQVNFLVPASVPLGTAEIIVSSSAGASSATVVPVTASAPGIFFDTASGLGAVLVAGSTRTSPTAGEIIEIYATGLGSLTAPEVRIAGLSAPVLYSGPAPGFPGLFQLNARVPAGLTAGIHSLRIVGSNEVRIRVQ